ncbi:hypothetical protein [Yoonia sp. I 8.24]|uniref:hypothetical protein n=1 Tax=Yoonia sp. I 8.24 TaxID=1537229 RepID=UPI001EDDCA16|nr:hypothetical protein [Yoonia sp. I 8.24]MCG3266133.1 hypothetical protein [Yoonia sp. I 8.24]
MFDRDQFALIAKALGAIERVFVLSINDRPEVRDLFRDGCFAATLVCANGSNGP